MSNGLVQICRGFTVEQWKALRPRLAAGDQAAWNLGVDVFARRIRERYLSSIEALLHADSGATADVDVPPGAPADGSTLPGVAAVVPGFAIVALCCLVIDALQSFRPGASNSTKDQFLAFLRRSTFAGGAFTDEVIAANFVKGIRHAVLHQAETRGWLLWRSDPAVGIVEDLGGGRFALNRTAFYEAIKVDFEEYCVALLSGRDGVLRQRFSAQMDDMLKKA